MASALGCARTLDVRVVLDMASNQTSALDDLIAERKILVCVGSGGVGKTTTSAAIALRAAKAGKNALVVTVDPARRLANALGMASMPSTAVEVPLENVSGRLSGLMFDTKTTFDAVIRKHAKTAKEAEEILTNPFYEKASTTLAGAHEYMAMEQLLMVHEEKKYDLIVLDTPPSAHAIDFLEAPERLLRFLDSIQTRAMLRTARAMKGPLGLFRITGLVARGVSRFIGSAFFENLIQFIQSFDNLYDGFRTRAARAQSLIRSDATGFVVVHAPEESTLREAARFDTRLSQANMNVDAFLANRVHLAADFDVEIAQEQVEQSCTNEPALELYTESTRLRLAQKIITLHQQLEFLAKQDHEALTTIANRANSRTPAVPLFVTPHFDAALHNLEGLDTFACSTKRFA